MANDEAVTPVDAAFIEAAERRIAAHLEEVERGKGDGRLAELISRTPSIHEQLGRQTEAPA